MNEPAKERSTLNQIELIVYDNDGPEGHFSRHWFPRSADAIQFIVGEYGWHLAIHNFEILNHQGGQHG